MSDRQKRRERAIVEVIHELDRSIRMHGNIASTYEAYGIIMEEVEEAWDIIKQKHPVLIDLRNELLQVAAMAIKAIVDVCDPGIEAFHKCVNEDQSDVLDSAKAGEGMG